MVLKKRSIEKKQLKFARFVLAPVKVLLCSARDLCVSTFCACAGRIGEGSAVMAGFVILPQVYPMPGSYSGSSSTKVKRSVESSRELSRMITTTNANENRSESNGCGRGKLSVAESGSCQRQRSYSIGVGQIGRIDEDAPCDFVETNGCTKNIMYSKCKSYAF